MFTMSKVAVASQMGMVVVGVGNELREDDGIGLVVVTELGKTGFGQNIDLLVLGERLFGLAEAADHYRRMVVIDAMPPEGNPGRITVISGQRLVRNSGEHFSLHDLDLVWQVQTASAMSGCDIWVIGIEAAALGWRLGLSRLIRERLPEILVVVRKQIMELFGLKIKIYEL